MIKMHLTHDHGYYSATILSDDEAMKHEKNGECVVEISEIKAMEWAQMLAQLERWDEYWKMLSNDVHDSKYRKRA